MSSPMMKRMFGFWSAPCAAIAMNAAQNITAYLIIDLSFMVLFLSVLVSLRPCNPAEEGSAGTLEEMPYELPPPKNTESRLTLYSPNFCRASPYTRLAQGLCGLVPSITNRRFQFQKRRQQLIRTHDEAVSVAA